MPGRFKLDENIPGRVEPALRYPGLDVETANSEGLAGAPDPDLLAACLLEDRILVTLDLDFADIRAYPPGSHRGIRVLRPAIQSFASVLDLVLPGVRLSSDENCVVAWTVRGEHHVLVDMLGARNRWWDAHALLDRAFARVGGE